MRVFRGLNAITPDRLQAISMGKDLHHPEWTTSMENALQVATTDRPGARVIGYGVILVGELVCGTVEVTSGYSVDLTAGGTVQPINFFHSRPVGTPATRRAALEAAMAMAGIVNPHRAARLMGQAEARS